MEHEPRGYAGPMSKGMNKGRGEDWLAAWLLRRGHNPIQQYPVWRHDQLGRYYIDVAVGSVAVELYSYWQEPWQNDNEVRRAENLLLDSWRVMYVWLQEGSSPSEAVVDAVVSFVIDAAAGSVQTYRVIDHSGSLIRVGGLGRTDELVSEPPLPRPYCTKYSWTGNPPEAPTKIPDDKESSFYARFDQEAHAAYRAATPAMTLTENNDLRRQWWEFNEAFAEWLTERENRKRPWEQLPPKPFKATEITAYEDLLIRFMGGTPEPRVADPWASFNDAW